MPWCPKCRQEFVATAKRCFDCEVDLVADLHALDVGRTQAAAIRPVRIVAPGAFLASLEAWLGQNQVPFRRSTDGQTLEVPAGLVDSLETSLAQIVELERDEDVIRVLGPRTAKEPELPVDESVLKLGVEELAADPGTSISRLVGLCASQQPRQRRWAAQGLRDLEKRGVCTRLDVVCWTIREGYRRPLFGLVHELKEEPPAGLAPRIAGELKGLPVRSLPLALHVLSQFPDPSVASAVLPLLEHEDPEVRAEADEVLMSASGQDMQFDAEADESERARKVQLWRDWIARRA